MLFIRKFYLTSSGNTLTFLLGSFLCEPPEQTDIFGNDIRKTRSARAKRTPRSNLDNVIEGKKGILLVSSKKQLQYNVSRCTDIQLFRARHVHEIEVSPDTVYIRLDAAQRGLGTGSCGPQTLPEYQVNSGTFEINFWIKPTRNL